MDFPSFVQWVFYGVIGSAAAMGVSILWHIKNSIDVLNERVAVIIEKTAWHERAIEEHNNRLRDLETKPSRRK